MQKLKLFFSMCYDTWSDFTKHFFAISLLLLVFVGLNYISAEMQNYIIELLNFIPRSFLIISDDIIITVEYIASLIRACLLAAGYIFFMQHTLDIVYKRKIVWLSFSTATLHALLFDMVVNYVMNKSGMQPYFTFEFLAITDLFNSESGYLTEMLYLSTVFGFLVLYCLLLFRFLFIDLFILETKSSLKQAFNQSWNLARGNGILYLLCFRTPILMQLTIFWSLNYLDMNNSQILLCVQILAWLVFAWGLLLRARLFQTLRE